MFVRDLQMGVTKPLSATPAGASGDGNSLDVALSGDGRFVASSYSTDLTATPDANAEPDVFLRDLRTGVTSLVSRNRFGTAGGAAGGGSFAPRFSGDGSLLLFQSFAPDLAAGDYNQCQDVFASDTVPLAPQPTGPVGQNAAPGGTGLVFSAAGGTLTLAGTAGLTFSAGDGTADAVLSFAGTTDAVRAAPDGLRFVPAAGFAGTGGFDLTRHRHWTVRRPRRRCRSGWLRPTPRRP